MRWNEEIKRKILCDSIVPLVMPSDASELSMDFIIFLRTISDAELLSSNAKRLRWENESQQSGVACGDATQFA